MSTMMVDMDMVDMDMDMAAKSSGHCQAGGLAGPRRGLGWFRGRGGAGSSKQEGKVGAFPMRGTCAPGSRIFPA